MLIQSDAAIWTQANNTGYYEKTEELLVSPAIMEIPAGKAQIFRVSLRGAFPKSGERAFRLFLEDVSEPAEGSGINLRIRHDLPVMVAGSKIGKALARLGPCDSPNDKICVHLDNIGDRHLRVTNLQLAGTTWRQEIDTVSVVLAGAWKEWSFGRPADYTGPLTVNAETSAGPLSIELPALSR